MSLHSIISREADTCVKCGMCLPHCPTYARTLDENESPRGRIALMQGLALQQLAPGAALAAHLDHCLSCRACERVCPSGVPYGHLLDTTRELLEHTRVRARRSRMLRWLGLDVLVRHRGWRRLAGRVLRLYQRSGVQALARRSGLLRRLGLAAWDGMLPRLPALGRWRALYPARGPERGRVALFTGCTGDTLDSDTLRAAVHVLTRCGFTVQVPTGQGCCGALHQHNGALPAARDLARRNLAAFGALEVEAVVSVASGCGAQLREYDRLDWDTAGERDQARALAGRVVDINQFLDAHWPADLSLAPLRARVAVHEPCSLRNVLRQQQAPYRMLARIPGLEALPLPGNARCCGAGGSYMLSQPAVARALREDALQGLDALQPALLVSANVGCALHLAAGLREQGQDLEVVHPIVVLDRQLRAADAGQADAAHLY